MICRPLLGWAPPAALYAATEARAPSAFWLDAGDDAARGWSYLGAGAPDEAGPGAVVIDGTTSHPDDPDAPPFRGGWVGWLDYDGAARRAGAPAEAEEESRWLRIERLLAFDHARGRVWAVAPTTEIDAWADAAQRRIDAAAPVDARGSSRSAELSLGVASARHTPTVYRQLIEQCRELIRQGEAYQLCLTTRFEVAGVVDPVETYLRLRQLTPAHHGGFVRIGDRALLSASPEQFLHVEAGRIRTRPIKGTRPRGADEASDTALAAELLHSEKERAENVMIVDLMRNDLSRVCAPGTIRTDELFLIESYPAVHQLVSTVTGRSIPGLTASALWAATFPAGSMTGAPKLSAMTHLHGLEGAPRGIFSGCFGYVGDDGVMDMAMVIRSIVVSPDGAYVGAGGGITWRSDALAEFAEVATKARAPLVALGVRLPSAWEGIR